MPERTTSRTNSITSNPTSSPYHGDGQLLPVVSESAVPVVNELNFGTVRPEDFVQAAPLSSLVDATSESPSSDRSSVAMTTLEGLTSTELENFMRLCQQRYMELNPNAQQQSYSQRSVERAAEQIHEDMRPKRVFLNPGTIVPDFVLEAPRVSPEFILPTVEEILSSPGWFTLEQLNALSDRDRQFYWKRASEYREQLRIGTLSNAMHRVYNPAHTQSKADAEYRELFAKRGREDLRYMTVPPEMRYLDRRRQDYAEAKMTADGHYVPLAGTGNEDNVRTHSMVGLFEGIPMLLALHFVIRLERHR